MLSTRQSRTDLVAIPINDPNRFEYGSECLDTCAWLRWKGSYDMWIPEGRALLKEKRLGSAGTAVRISTSSATTFDGLMALATLRVNTSEV